MTCREENCRDSYGIDIVNRMQTGEWTLSVDDYRTKSVTFPTGTYQFAEVCADLTLTLC